MFFMTTAVVSTAFTAAAKPQGSHARSNAFMGHHKEHDWHAKGERYIASSQIDPSKLERDLLNSRLSLCQDTLSDIEKTQARRPRCAHCAQLRTAVPALPSSAHICPSPARAGALRTPAQLCTLSVPLLARRSPRLAPSATNAL